MNTEIKTKQDAHPIQSSQVKPSASWSAATTAGDTDRDGCEERRSNCPLKSCDILAERNCTQHRSPTNVFTSNSLIAMSGDFILSLPLGQRTSTGTTYTSCITLSFCLQTLTAILKDHVEHDLTPQDRQALAKASRRFVLGISLGALLGGM